MDNGMAARALGMNDDEVVAVVDAPDGSGTVVQTIDGALTLIGDDGVVGYYGEPVPGYSGDVHVYQPSSEDLANVRAALAELGTVPRQATHEVAAARQALAGAPIAEAAIEQDEAGTKALVGGGGPGYAKSEANDETGARNLSVDRHDPGTNVPDGSAKDVEEWVGDDPARARQALDFERSKDNPRATLVRHLQAKAGDPTRTTEH